MIEFCEDPLIYEFYNSFSFSKSFPVNDQLKCETHTLLTQKENKEEIYTVTPSFFFFFVSSRQRSTVKRKKPK